jgi:uncharacterized protein YcfJ
MTDRLAFLPHRRRSTLAVAIAAMLVVASALPADAGRRKVIQGAAIGAGVGGVVGLVVGGPRAGVAGAAVGGTAGALIGASQRDCYWRTNSRGRHYKVCR